MPLSESEIHIRGGGILGNIGRSFVESYLATRRKRTGYSVKRADLSVSWDLDAG